MSLDIFEIARLADAARWVETRLFEMLGGWLASTDEPGVELVLARHGNIHGWHADLWSDRMPELAEVDANAPRAPAVEDLVGAVADAGTTIDRLSGMYRVLLPLLVAGYTSRRELIDRRVDGPTARVLDLCLHDTVEHVIEGERLLADASAGAAGAAAAAASRQRFEALLGRADDLLAPGGSGAS